MTHEDLRGHAPATVRNRDAILALLQPELAPGQHVLEVGSGTGEHIVHFAQALPQVHWQPTEADPGQLPSIAAWTQHAELTNVAAPLAFDIVTDPWPDARYDAIVCINVVHYTPWETVPALMAGAARTLRPGGLLYTYGAYRRNGKHTSASNEAFEQWLKARNPQFGVRDLEAVAHVANQNGLALEAVHPMPANNFSLMFRQQPERQESD